MLRLQSLRYWFITLLLTLPCMASSTRPSRHTVFLVDTSTSVFPFKESLIHSLSQTLVQNCEQGDEEDRVSVLAFNSEVRETSISYLCCRDLIDKHRRYTGVFDQHDLDLAEGTALFDAIESSIQWAAEIPNQQEEAPMLIRLVIISDGGDNRSKEAKWFKEDPSHWVLVQEKRRDPYLAGLRIASDKLLAYINGLAIHYEIGVELSYTYIGDHFKEVGSPMAASLRIPEEQVHHISRCAAENQNELEKTLTQTLATLSEPEPDFPSEALPSYGTLFPQPTEEDCFPSSKKRAPAEYDKTEDHPFY